MRKTPKGLRLHIAIFGRRNVGKSSILNALTHQDISIVSDIPGTTTDPVEKPMELLPIGPVLFIDTAGLDDSGRLGYLRVEKTYEIFGRADIILLIAEANVWGEYEKKILEEAKKRNTPILVLLNKIDILKVDENIKENLESEKISCLKICALDKTWNTTAKIKTEIIKILPDDCINPVPVIFDLIDEDDLIILVIPIDKEAPKGRLILPQQQTIREILDRKARCLICSEKSLSKSINDLKQKPKIIVTDSQVLGEVFSQVPEDILVTSFSILFARSKGDLGQFVKGAKKIDELGPSDKILIAEACTHHPIGDDIGRIKIPRWINQRRGGGVKFDVISGHDIPLDLEKYKLVIHCGACMFNRKEMLTRILKCKEKGVAITNYGLAIAYLYNVLDRVLEPFKPTKATVEAIVG